MHVFFTCFLHFLCLNLVCTGCMPKGEQIPVLWVVACPLRISCASCCIQMPTCVLLSVQTPVRIHCACLLCIIVYIAKLCLHVHFTTTQCKDAAEVA